MKLLLCDCIGAFHGCKSCDHAKPHEELPDCNHECNWSFHPAMAIATTCIDVTTDHGDYLLQISSEL